MKRKLAEHLLSIVLVSAIFITGIVLFRASGAEQDRTETAEARKYLDLQFLDFDNPMHRAIFLETLDVFYPDQRDRNRSVLADIERLRAEEIARLTRRRQGTGLTSSKLAELGGMYLRFILVYVIVMALTYYGVKSLAIYRFVLWKQGRSSYLRQFTACLAVRPLPEAWRDRAALAGRLLSLFSRAVLRGAAYLILFSPAYVIAYAFKTRFDTDSVVFMILLGTISNGLLITYAQKFFTFLVNESRKGYVRTAIVKNLRSGYRWGDDGISRSSIFAVRKRFDGHAFQHIYLHARYLYLNTLKEQASFLITGLVIIEMALNIQGHLCYEMLQNLLYYRYDVVAAIILGIFLVVKATEIFTDGWYHLESARYDNTRP